MIRVRQVKVSVLKDNIDEVITKTLKKANISKDNVINYKINKRSIDARDKNDIFYVYEIDLNLVDEKKVKLGNDVVKIENEEYYFNDINLKKDSKIAIIGAGPCGLFLAYMLVDAGYKPMIFERGKKIEERVKDVDEFWKSNNLNINSNVQFGEGGAGTFSDGKLNTQIKDKFNRIKKVLDIFIENGAPKEIAYDYMPHIGTDKLRSVIKNMREHIIKNGGQIYFESCLTDIIIKDNSIDEIVINNLEKYKCDKLVLAIGHSARDTFYMLNEKNIVMENKPFAIGLRVIHKQEMIDQNQYGKFAKYMKPASYKLIHNINGHGIYSFCMCPGGYVVNASSFKNKLVINGMSDYNRDSGFANSAIIITVNENDYGSNLFDGVKYQEKLEKKAFEIGNGFIPVQRFEDYKKNIVSKSFGNIKPLFKGQYYFANLNLLLDKNLNQIMKSGIEYFDSKINGFASDDTVLAGIEARTSSPIRIIRDLNFECNIKGIYPSGEGAGYAGGITSAAIDGIKTFENIVKKSI